MNTYTNLYTNTNLYTFNEPNINYDSDTTEEYVSWQIDRTPDRPTLPNNDIQFIIDETLIITEEELHCCICMEDKERINICSLNCGHTFCETCVNECINLSHQYNCSLCREKVTIVKKCE
jgi:hypothetical protein